MICLSGVIMGSYRSGRYPHHEGKLKQIALKFPINAWWFMLAKRRCAYLEQSFSDYVRDLVKADIKKYRYTKMWSCECEDPRGKPLLNFKRQHYCPGCGKYQTAHHEQLYNKA
jgi:hypothetical protein